MFELALSFYCFIVWICVQNTPSICLSVCLSVVVCVHVCASFYILLIVFYFSSRNFRLRFQSMQVTTQIKKMVLN